MSWGYAWKVKNKFLRKSSLIFFSFFIRGRGNRDMIEGKRKEENEKTRKHRRVMRCPPQYGK
jgi:hypothetical protein